MALDAANFISELSITDPPGTDPLSQGDDQIRTIKRATFQSFPNIDAQVSLTTAQLNLAAIQNEQNIFTVQQTISGAALVMAKTTGEQNIFWQTNVEVDWSFRNTVTTQEFQLRRFIVGAEQAPVWTVDHITGVMDFDQVPTVQGAPLWIAGEIRMFAATATPGTNWFLADGTNGTVDLLNRVPMGSGQSPAGTAVAPNLTATAAASTTGSTAITVSQMPVHGHDIRGGADPGGVTDSTIAVVTNETVVGGNRSNPAGQYIRNNSSGNSVVRNEGAGAGHTHAQVTVDVVENGAIRETVRPLARVLEFHQYVP